MSDMRAILAVPDLMQACGDRLTCRWDPTVTAMEGTAPEDESPRGSGVPPRCGPAVTSTLRLRARPHRGGTPLPQGRCATFTVKPRPPVRDARVVAGTMTTATA